MAKNRYICPMCPGVESEVPASCPKCGMALELEVPVIAEHAIEYTCPMHPEVIQTEMGECPKCGMALEPRIVDTEEKNLELDDFTRRFKIGLIFTVPIVFLSMGGMVPAFSDFLAQAWNSWAQLFLAMPVVLYSGAPFFERGVRSIRSGHYNMFTLIALGTGAAFLFSIAAILFPGVFPENYRLEGGRVAVYFESAAVIIVLVLLGQILELSARSKVNSAVRALLDMAPKFALKLTSCGHEKKILVSQVIVGDKLRIKPGEKIPVDGVVSEGESYIDESMLTGEPVPVYKKLNDSLVAGTLNQKGSLLMEANKVGSDTVLSQIVKMVSEAQRSRAPVQNLADRVASVFVPAVVFISCLSFIFWLIFGPEPQLVYAILSSVAVLIIACPCALGLATPMSIMVGVGRGAQLGVLIKSAEALEKLEKITVIALDKTGTLTKGKPTVQEVLSISDTPENEILRLAGSIERSSEHPIGQAVFKAASEKKLALQSITNFKSETGVGVQGEVDGRVIRVAKPESFDSITDHAKRTLEKLRSGGVTVIGIGDGYELIGLISISDRIKHNAAEVIRGLHKEKLKILMITGDHRETASAVAKKLKIDEFASNVMPGDKLEIIKRLQEKGERVAMVGDGINDAPALSQADVGIAMGTGTDIAMESATVTLMSGDLQGLLRARLLSKHVMRNIRLNLVFAFGYNMIGVPIAAGILFPFFGLLLSPMIGSVAMSLSSVSVIGNALRLRSVSIP